MSEGVIKLEMPKRTYFGPGALERIGEAVRRFDARNAFVISDQGVAKAGLVRSLVDAVRAHAKKVSVFDETEPEPTVQSVGKALAALRRARDVDLLISLGGGSVMDTAKCANIVVMNGGSILDYEEGRENGRAIGDLIPHVAIPTTAGTGSEATVWAIFIDPKRKFKAGTQDPRLIADLVILDPKVTTTMPPRVTAATGMDALTHAIEAFVSASSNEFTDALAIKAIKLIADSLRKAVDNGGDIEARGNMLLASYMAGIAFSNSSCGIVHTLAEALGGFYRIPHGITNSLMLPSVMEFNSSARQEKFARIAELMGEDVRGLSVQAAAERSVAAVRRLSKDIRLPQTLREVGVRRKDIPALVASAYPWANISGNPREVAEGQLRDLYEKTF
ncbi:MAG: iron-containing alcohol dehydrogenase [Thermoplasmata archaeon]